MLSLNFYSEGWEKLGLYEYYKVKNAARKQKEEEIKDGLREKSRSPSPIVLEKPKPKKSNKRVYRWVKQGSSLKLFSFDVSHLDPRAAVALVQTHRRRQHATDHVPAPAPVPVPVRVPWSAP